MLIREAYNKLEALIGLYVDDLIIGTNNNDTLQETKRKLKSEFKIEDLGKCTQMLGMKLLQNNEGIYLNQSNHIAQLSEALKLQNLEKFKTPMTQGFDKSRTAGSLKLK